MAVLGDVLDTPAMDQVFAAVAPEGVVQLLNALPKRGPIRPSDIDATNELRTRGTSNLLAAARRQPLTPTTRRHLEIDLPSP